MIPTIQQLQTGQPVQQSLNGFNIFTDNKPFPEPRAVSVEIDWSKYDLDGNGNCAVLVNLQAQGPAQLLDGIRSIRVANLGSKNPIYILFSDLKMPLVCLPGVTVEPVITGQLQFVVYAENLSPGSMPITEIDVLSVNHAGYFVADKAQGIYGKFIGFFTDVSAASLVKVVAIPTVPNPSGDRLIAILARNSTGANFVTVATAASGNAIIDQQAAANMVGHYIMPRNTSDSLTFTFDANVTNLTIDLWELFNWQSETPYFSYVVPIALNILPHFSDGSYGIVAGTAQVVNGVINDYNQAGFSAWHYASETEQQRALNSISQCLVGIWR